MAKVTKEFLDRWRSRQHVGPAAPTLRVTLTRGIIDKDYQVFKMLDGSEPTFMSIVGGNNAEPWQGFWRATGEPKEIPNVLKVNWQQKLGEKGGRSATIEVENVVFRALNGPGGVYHAIARGWLSPTRGAHIVGRLLALGIAQNEWYEIMDNGYRIDVYEGYGDQMVHTYTGLIDTTDLQTSPDRITITSRSFWMLITDQRVMGSNKAPEIVGPTVTFADFNRTLGPKAIKGIRPRHWVLIKDLAGIAKTVFMWMGYKEWNVEPLGWSLVFPMSWTMDKFFMDMLEDAMSQAEWLAYEESPSGAANSLGVPCFVHNRATDKPPRGGMVELRDEDMLESVKPHFDLSQLPYIIISRGAVDSKNGGVYSSELVKRYMAVYFPPWSGAGPHITESGRTSGLRRHDYMVDNWLLSDEQCMFAALLTAQKYALEAMTCELQIAGNPQIELNTQISLISDVTGINSRVWVSEIQSEHTAGKEASWKMTIGGSLIDTIDMQQIAKDMAKQKVTVEDEKKLELR